MSATRGIEQIRRQRMRRGVQRTEKPDGVRGGAEEQRRRVQTTRRWRRDEQEKGTKFQGRGVLFESR